jgi:hypothetical protein
LRGGGLIFGTRWSLTTSDAAKPSSSLPVGPSVCVRFAQRNNRARKGRSERVDL